MTNLLTKSHGIVAADWQIKAAAEGMLKAIVLPLLPEPIKEGLLWFWRCELKSKHPWLSQAIELSWRDLEEAYQVGAELLKELPWQIGDRVYLQEAWAISEGGITLYQADEDDGLGYCPVGDMDLENARFCFNVTGVMVLQIKDLTTSNLLPTGMGGLTEHPENFNAMENWNTAHPNYLWRPDRYVIVLDIDPIEINSL
jgi:hypothetical protein